MKQFISKPATSICKLVEQCKTEGSVKPTEDVVINSLDARFQCGMHPRNWCDNLDSAYKCSSFEKCLLAWSETSFKYVLKPQVEEVGLNEGELNEEKTCGFCIFLFNKLQSILQQNATEVDVQQYLEGACSLLPTKDEADIVNNIAP
jgi:hypothetical protein